MSRPFFSVVSIAVWWRKTGLKQKILLLVALILLLAITATGLYSYFLAVEQATSKLVESQLNLVNQVSNNIDLVLTDVMDLSSLIIIDPGVQQVLQESPSDGQNILIYHNSLLYLDKILAAKSHISMVALYGLNGLVYSTGKDYTSNRVIPFQEFSRTSLFEKALQLDGSPGIEYFTNKPFIVYDHRIPRIILYRAVKEFNRFHNAGVLLLWINEENIRSLYRPVIPRGGSVFILDPKGKMISPAGGDPLAQEVLLNHNEFSAGPGTTCTININKQKMLLTAAASEITGWWTVALTPMDLLAQNLKSIASVIILVGFVCYMFLFFLSLYITSVLTTPLQQLQDSIEKVQKGDFSQQIPSPGEDEIGRLSRGYNIMITRIRDLIDRVYKLGIRRREAELKALQAQINPHFLYNTLDTLFWKAEKKHVPEIGEMVYALSKIFRLSLNRGNDLTTVGREKELIEHYLLVQKMRLKNKLSYTVDIDRALWDRTIPKLILQPFVENAVIHGIEEKESSGEISVTGRTEDELMVFTIRDDGVGMTEEKIKLLQSKEPLSPENLSNISGGYAVHNILERLDLYFKENYRVTFTGKPGSGTTVIIAIPELSGEEEENGEKRNQDTGG